MARPWKRASSAWHERATLMMGYALKRFLGALPTLFIIVTLAFFMMRAAPGGPFDSQRQLPPEIEHNIKAAYDLDKPLIEQYCIYLGTAGAWRSGPVLQEQGFHRRAADRHRPAGERAAGAFAP